MLLDTGNNFDHGAHDRITWGGQISIGLDRLKYGLHVEWPSEELFDLLGEWKREAQKVHQAIAVDFKGREDQRYNMHTTGRSGGYAFHISRADVHLFFSVRKDFMATPNIWVDVGSASCWSPGYQAVIEIISDLVFQFKGKIRKMELSEVHLCADCIGLDIEDLGIQVFSRWITRANKFHAYAERTKFSGISLDQSEFRLGISDKEIDFVGIATESGLSVGMGDIALRIYDKTLELKSNGAKQSLFASVWNQTKFGDEPVTRVEFQLRRPVLRQLGVKSLPSLFEKLGGVWSYCTTQWAKFCAPFDRKNRHQDRAITDPWWGKIQEVDWGSYQKITRKVSLPQKDKYQLQDMMLGCALNLAAINKCSEDPNEISVYCQAEIGVLCHEKNKVVDEETGDSILVDKMRVKINEIWPFGHQEIHGHEVNHE